jgi:hypothetical protein
MTFAQIRPEIDALTKQDRDCLSAYLTMLQMEENEDLENEQMHKLERSSDWVDLKDLNHRSIH